MSKFTKYRKKKRVEAEERYNRMVESCKKLDEFKAKVQKLYSENPGYQFDLKDPKSIELWNEYMNKEYYDSLTQEFA